MTSQPLLGSFLAIGASLFWTLAPFLFASAVRSIGAWRVNPLRLAAAALILTALAAAYAVFDRSVAFDMQAPVLAWLAVSGVVGLVIGDALYLTSLGFLGPRRTLQILVLAPAISALIAWLWLGERITAVGTIGLVVTLAALSLATALDQRRKDSNEPGAFSWPGLLIALAASVCHGSAAVLARKAFLIRPDLNPVLATSTRIVSSAAAIWIWVVLRGQAVPVLKGCANRPAMKRLAAAVLLGPVLGMICYVSAFKTTPAGVVSLLSSLSPVLIIPITAWRYKTRLDYAALACMAMAIAGVVMVVLR